MNDMRKKKEKEEGVRDLGIPVNSRLRSLIAHSCIIGWDGPLPLVRPYTQDS